MSDAIENTEPEAPAVDVCEGCEKHCTLDQARRGDRMVVLGVHDAQARIHAIRFGMAEGSTVSCVTRIPAGPIVLRSGRQEIAVGRELAKRISVRPCTDTE
jgi:Fe2+ transport system protein FeoA